MSKPWLEDFFDADYLHLWRGMITEERTRHEAQGLWQLLDLGEGSRVLDAPCGYGRLSRPLAERGARVLGVDQSQLLIDQAEHERGELPKERLRYLRHDLRHPLSEDRFDAAINIFSSLGYGTEEDDLSILNTLAQRPYALVVWCLWKPTTGTLLWRFDE
ncbi:MAG: class I SAM-dependent methyltransferase [Acidobacteriota bacterium]